jgi:hypothetical protein
LVILFSCPIWSFINNHSGADVGHPGPGVAKPSVTGVVFSYDKEATGYAALTEIQHEAAKEVDLFPRWSIGRRIQHHSYS